jgi:GDSL-like Lipase/Acylhydrolase family
MQAMIKTRADGTGAIRKRARHAAAFVLILAVQFGIFEAALRFWGSSEAAPSFQGLFEDDPVIGYRLKPGAQVRFTTSEFDADIAINGQGVRDDDEIGPKASNEKRIVVLGDSLVLSVQVPFEQTFGERLEARLNAATDGTRYRVINAGVQGYGPVEEALFWERIASAVQPDLVLATVFVGNDAEEAVQSERKLDSGAGATETVRDSAMIHLRRLVRRSMVLQILRLRVVSATERLRPNLAAPEPPLQAYAANPAPRIARGIGITRRCLERIIGTASAHGAQTAIVLMPARFQVDDGDYGRLKAEVAQSGGELVRDAANRRFETGLAGMGVARLDLLPALRAALPGADLFYQETVHFTPRGHVVVAEALDEFITGHGLLKGEPTQAVR